MDINKTIFVNVDTQVDFMDPDGKLYVPNAEKIKPNLKNLTDFAKQNNIKVLNTMDWHFPKSKELSDTPDFVNTFPPHCMANTQGSRFIPETSPEPGATLVIDWAEQKGLNFHDIHKFRNIIIRKDAFDVFEGNPLTTAIMNNLGIPFLDRPNFVVYGVSKNVCVKYVVEGLTKRGFGVTVVTDATVGLSNIPDPQPEWEKDNTIQFITTEEVLKLKYEPI